MTSPLFILYKNPIKKFKVSIQKETLKNDNKQIISNLKTEKTNYSKLGFKRPKTLMYFWLTVDSFVWPERKPLDGRDQNKAGTLRMRRAQKRTVCGFPSTWLLSFYWKTHTQWVLFLPSCVLLLYVMQM